MSAFLSELFPYELFTARIPPPLACSVERVVQNGTKETKGVCKGNEGVKRSTHNPRPWACKGARGEGRRGRRRRGGRRGGGGGGPRKSSCCCGSLTAGDTAHGLDGSWGANPFSFGWQGGCGYLEAPNQDIIEGGGGGRGAIRMSGSPPHKQE